MPRVGTPSGVTPPIGSPPTAVSNTPSTARRARAYRDWTYWGRPVPGFGDPDAELYVVGLAPAAHGGNRTGRVFTGDRSGDWVYGALHRAGYANQGTSTDLEDGLQLTGAYIGAIVRCAPPDNRPAREERAACMPFARRELDLLGGARVVVALGKPTLTTPSAILSDCARAPSSGTWPRRPCRTDAPCSIPSIPASATPSRGS